MSTTPTRQDPLEERRRAFQTVMDQESIAWERNEILDLKFETGRYTMFVLFDPMDPVYVRVVFPRFFSIPNMPDDRARAYRAINTIGQRVKLATIGLQTFDEPNQMDASASVEMLVIAPAMVTQDLFLRTVACLHKASQAYVHELMVGE